MRIVDDEPYFLFKNTCLSNGTYQRNGTCLRNGSVYQSTCRLIALFERKSKVGNRKKQIYKKKEFIL